MKEKSYESKLSNELLQRAVAVIFDVLVVVLFVAIGKSEHGATYGIEDYVQISLPFLFSFFVVQLILGKDICSVKFGAIAAVISVPIAMLIRVNLPRVVGHEEYSFKPVFAIISLLFMTFGWTIWRFVLSKVRREKA